MNVIYTPSILHNHGQVCLFVCIVFIHRPFQSVGMENPTFRGVAPENIYYEDTKAGMAKKVAYPRHKMERYRTNRLCKPIVDERCGQ